VDLRSSFHKPRIEKKEIEKVSKSWFEKQ